MIKLAFSIYHLSPQPIAMNIFLHFPTRYFKYDIRKHLKVESGGGGEMAQLFRALVALAEDVGSQLSVTPVPRIPHIAVTTTDTHICICKPSCK